MTKYGINRNCLYFPPSKSLDQLDLSIVCKHKLTLTSKKSPGTTSRIHTKITSEKERKEER